MSSKFSCAVLPDRALVAVTGPDWRRFLQGLITQDVDTLAEGELRFGAMLTPQGRLLFDMFILGGEDGCTLDVQAGQRDDLVQRLTIYRLRAKVQIAPMQGEVLVAWGEGEPGAGWSRDPRLAALGWRGLDLPCPAGAQVVRPADYNAHRLALGIPDPALDCIPDKTYPIEADFDLLNGIDFHKGCFVGQETTSRMKRRGQIKTRSLPITFEGFAPSVGAEILTADNLRAGEVLSVGDGQAMALLRLDRAEGPLRIEASGPVLVAYPDWTGLAAPA